MTPKAQHETRQGQDMLLLRQELGFLERATTGVKIVAKETAQGVAALQEAVGHGTETDPRSIRDLLVELIVAMRDLPGAMAAELRRSDPERNT